jgi:hypothetical protein
LEDEREEKVEWGALAIEKAAFPVAMTLSCRLGLKGVFRTDRLASPKTGPEAAPVRGFLKQKDYGNCALAFLPRACYLFFSRIAKILYFGDSVIAWNLSFGLFGARDVLWLNVFGQTIFWRRCVEFWTPPR